MDGRLLWVLFSFSALVSLVGGGLSAWTILAWKRTPAGKASEAIETGLRVATFRLAQMDGQLAALKALLQEETAKSIPLTALEDILERKGTPRSEPPEALRSPPVAIEEAPTPRATALSCDPGVEPRSEERVAITPRSGRTDTMRLEPGIVPVPHVVPPAWVRIPPRENQG